MSSSLDSRVAISVARQPILDSQRRVFGYDLLYSESDVTAPAEVAADVASSRLVTDTLLGIGWETLTAGRRGFVTLTRPLLLNGAARLLPKDGVIISVGADVGADDGGIAACQELQRAGYRLAVNDFTADSDAERLLPFVEFVKIDVLRTIEWRDTTRRLRRLGRSVIATQVERSDVAADAYGAGCSLFQGYYFCRPATLSGPALPPQQQAALNLFASLNRADITIDKLEMLVKRDLSLSLRVLRSINSAAFAIEQPITSLRQALVLLGIQQVRRWASVWALAGLSANSPSELVSVTLLRARLCEILGRARFGEEAAGELFLLGMCSTLDVILDRPMERALASLPVSSQLRGTLLGERGEWRTLLDVVIARERGYWSTLSEMLPSVQLSPPLLSNAYLDALGWAQAVTVASAVA